MRHFKYTFEIPLNSVLSIPADGKTLAQSVDEATGNGGESNTAVLLFALGILLMLSILTRQLFRAYRRSRRKSPHKTVKQVREESAKHDARTSIPLVDAPAVYARWHAELHDVVRQAQAEIDTKLRLLQATIHLANESVHQLNESIARANSLLNAADTVNNADEQCAFDSEADSSETSRDPVNEGKQGLTSDTNPNHQLNDVTEQLRTLTDQTIWVTDQLNSQKRTPQSTGETAALNSEKSNNELRLFPKLADEEPSGTLQDQVRSLAEQGWSAARIAQETGIPHGDVDLYLSTLPFAPRGDQSSTPNP